MSEVEIAWAAGLFEGEGCIGLRRDTASGRAYLRIQLMSSDKDVVLRFREAIGRGRVNGPYQRHPDRKPLWQCTLNSLDAREGLALIGPHLCERRTARMKEVLSQVDEPIRKRKEQ